MEKNYHTFTELPAYTKTIWGPDAQGRPNEKLLNELDPYKWSGDNPPPPIGAKVKLYLNDFQSGTVIGYFAEYGFLGCLVKIAKPPAWWVRQTRERGDNPATTPGHFFGVDLQPRKKKETA